MATTPTTRVTDLSRRHQVDVDTANYPASLYEKIPAVFDLKLIEDLRTSDDETNDDDGYMRELVTGVNMRLEGKIKWSKNSAQTAFNSVHMFLRAKFNLGKGSNQLGAEFGCRWYDRNGLDDGQSYEARAYLKSWAPDGGTPDQPDNIAFVIQIQGKPTAITNPNGSLLPVVSGLSVAAGGIAGGGNPIRIFGRNFNTVTGVAGVKFGGTNAAYVVNSDVEISAVPPAHAAGVVQVLVTNPSGPSVDTAADDYTYA